MVFSTVFACYFFPNKPQNLVGYTVFFICLNPHYHPTTLFQYIRRVSHIIPFTISSYRVRHIMEREAEQLLTQHCVSEHSSTDSEPESPPHPNKNNIWPRLLSQRSIVYLDSDSSESGDFTSHSPPPPRPTPSPPTNDDDIESQTIMESRPNSSPENSTWVPLQSISQDAVLEHYVLTRAIDHWNGMDRNMRLTKINLHVYRISSFTTGQI